MVREWSENSQRTVREWSKQIRVQFHVGVSTQSIQLPIPKFLHYIVQSFENLIRLCAKPKANQQSSKDIINLGAV